MGLTELLHQATPFVRGAPPAFSRSTADNHTTRSKARYSDPAAARRSAAQKDGPPEPSIAATATATASVIMRPFSWPDFIWAGGLAAARVVEIADLPERVRSAVLIGIDLGPNLSVTGSLATSLRLFALRRERQNVGAWNFLKLGAPAMPPALILAIAGAFAFG